MGALKEYSERSQQSKKMLLSLILLTFCLHFCHSQDRACAEGSCVLLQECPELARLLQKLNPQSLKRLQQSTCGFSSSNPKVCCPAMAPDGPPVTPRAPRGPLASATSNLLPSNCGQSFRGERIFGGSVANIGSYPWMALLGYQEPGAVGRKFLCGGAVVNQRYILTAGHCVHASELGGRILEVVRLGEWNLTSADDCQVLKNNICSTGIQEFQPEEVTFHPQYNTRTRFSDDIALIRVDRPIIFDTIFVNPICLPPKGLPVKEVIRGRDVIAAGWGFTEQFVMSNTLKHVKLPLVDNSVCNTTFGGRVLPEQLCAGGRSGQDSCAGDSGGPLMVEGPFGPPYLQVGIVSYGSTSCGRSNIPGVYTSVSHYRDWIDATMKP